jgi:hypothetical protein
LAGVPDGGGDLQASQARLRKFEAPAGSNTVSIDHAPRLEVLAPLSVVLIQGAGDWFD